MEGRDCRSTPPIPSPRIAIVITELGPSVSTAESAIRHLPAEVTLSFLTFAPDVARSGE